MSDDDTAEAEAAIDDPGRLRSMIEPRGAWYRSAKGTDLVGALTGRFPDPEVAALAPHATEFVACIAHAVTPGVDGWIDDWRALVRPWGFDVADVAVPVVLWHGELDDSCPLAHAVWLHARLPHSRLEVQPGEGHLAIGVSHPREMFEALTTAVAEI
jgi:pimeloyl-ACP methyl ester carboxylesterase